MDHFPVLQTPIGLKCMKTRFNSHSRGLVLSSGALILMFLSGCAQLARKYSVLESELAEHSRAFTAGVVDTLQLQPEARRDEFTGLALTLAREDQRVEGAAARPLAVEALLGIGETNENARIEKQTAAARDLRSRFERVQTLLEREKDAEAKLRELGEVFDAQRSEKRAQWWKWGASASAGVAGLIASILFFPAATPIAGRVLGALVNRMPALAGPAGVVSVDAFDAVVKAIERSKENVPLENEVTKTGSWFEDLAANLSRELDASHKRLVSARKKSIRAKAG